MNWQERPERLTDFARRYLPLFHRSEQRDHALTGYRAYAAARGSSPSTRA